MSSLDAVTADDLKRRYPVFKGEDADLIDALLDEARGSVNDTWIEADRKPALLALAAHLLFIDRYASGVVELDGQNFAVTGALESLKVGDTDVKFAHKFVTGEGQSASANDYGATPYGQRYLSLFRRSFPPVMIV